MEMPVESITHPCPILMMKTLVRMENPLHHLLALILIREAQICHHHCCGGNNIVCVWFNVIIWINVFCSLSDPHTAPLVTGNKSHDREFSYAHAAGSHVNVAATGRQAVKSRLAVSFDLKTDEDRQLLGNQQGSSSHTRRASGSNKSTNFTEPRSK